MICQFCRDWADKSPEGVHDNCIDTQRGIGVHDGGRWCDCQHEHKPGIYVVASVLKWIEEIKGMEWRRDENSVSVK